MILQSLKLLIMGLNANSTKLLFAARNSGVGFQRVLTLGRQFLDCPPRVMKDLARRYGFTEKECAWVDQRPDRYADPLFHMLGAEQVSALDYSNYEGADIIHDLNTPLPGNLHGQFDVVLDGGALEHVFDFPTAIRNCMNLVRVGGRLIHLTPINNYCGHGFYQFSPELFFRILSEANGYQVEACVAWEEALDALFYEIRDPAQIGQRIELINCYPALMMVQAKKIAESREWCPPQQSDYTQLWTAVQKKRADSRRRGPGWSRGFRQAILGWVYMRFPYGSRALNYLHRWLHAHRHSMRQKPGFEPLGRLKSPAPVRVNQAPT
jgi:SAM-dependent methyltransferase